MPLDQKAVADFMAPLELEGIVISQVEAVEYDDSLYMLPTIDYGGESLCTGCGMCCWDWKNNDPKVKCELLADDMKTCTVFGEWDKHGKEGCAPPLQPYQFVDLPPECGYVKYWAAKGCIKVI